MKKAAKADPRLSLLRTILGADWEAEVRFDLLRRWRFDYASEARKIAIEIEGGVYSRGRHTRPTGFLNDIEKYNAATLQGWRVLRCTPQTFTALLVYVKSFQDKEALSD
jgi:hypothetical protein